MEEPSARVHVRTIKTGRCYFPVVPARTNNFTGLRVIPWIRLRGIWLEKAGFSVGQILDVQVEHQQIVISVKTASQIVGSS